MILAAIATRDSVDVETILTEIDATTPAVLAALTALEMAGRIRAYAGRKYAAIS